MAKITFVILAHENAKHVADLAHLVTGWDKDAHAVIHYDLKSPAAEFAKLKSEFQGSKRVHFVTDRIKCGWGDFSLVDAVVRSLRVIRKSRIDCDRVMLISGACMPIRPLSEFSSFLDANPQTEFIEAFDSNWIVGGLRKERYQYWHFFNHQTQHTLFNYHYKIQRKVWPKRRFPKGLEPRFGSQWWCLSWQLCEKILDYVKSHPMVYFFFSTTWIPDEMFFQTMAFHFTPINNLSRRTLTFFHFNDWGKPLVFLDDHTDLLREVPYFFARKISYRAENLRGALKQTALAPIPEKPLEIDFSTPYIFPYKKLLNALPRAAPSVAPALFQHRSKDGWSQMLDNCSKSFAILYGPPQLTRRASAVLASKSNELTVFGRLFHPDMVDLGPDKKCYKGLHADDNRIRDMDLPYYFNRILNRCSTLPVFELCPGDDPVSELALLQSENAIVMPIVPGNEEEIMQQLYWILCSRRDAERDHADTPIATFRSMLKSVDGSISKEYRDRTETFLKNARTTSLPAPDRWQTALEFQHGSSVVPLAQAYEDVLRAVQTTPMQDLIAGMPAGWKQTVQTLSNYDPEWQILRLNVPIVLPELWTTSMQLQALALSKFEKARKS